MKVPRHCLNQIISQAQWHVTVVSATQEAKAGESFEPVVLGQPGQPTKSSLKKERKKKKI
jgi:hypothetical protein